jgi:simple sugar transport system ATP-binding protein
VIFITHNPHHAYPVGDHFVILKRGQIFGDYAKADVSLEHLVQMMAGGADLEVLQHELEEATSGEDPKDAAGLTELADEIGAEADILEQNVEESEE